MSKNVTFIEMDGKPAFAVVPIEDYNRMTAASAEDISDAVAYALTRGEEGFPVALVKREIAGEHPVAIFRDHRGLTAAALADATGLSRAYISEIENGKKTGSAATLLKIARALEVDVELLIKDAGGDQRPG